MLKFLSPVFILPFLLPERAKKKANSPLRPTYPCFDQDLGDSEGAGNLPTQRWWILLSLQNPLSKIIHIVMLERRLNFLVSVVYRQ